MEWHNSTYRGEITFQLPIYKVITPFITAGGPTYKNEENRTAPSIFPESAQWPATREASLSHGFLGPVWWWAKTHIHRCIHSMYLDKLL